jgi:choline dehydrogenase-like flavoprotein
VDKLHLNLKDCNQEGFCNLGCSSGGKQGTLEVQIPNAIKSGIELIPNFTVTRLNDGVVYGDIAKAPAGTLSGRYSGGPVEIKAKHVVLAAGSPGSPALLLRSGFGKEFPVLGRYITLHPAQTVYGIYPGTIRNYRGFPKMYYTSQFTESHHYYIETAFYYPFVTTKHLGLWGSDLKETMKSYNRLMCMIILNHDEADPENCVVLDGKGNPQIRYNMSKESAASLCHAQAQASRIMFSSGCEKAIMPCADRPVFSRNEVPDQSLEDFISVKNYIPIKVPIASAHPQGGCRMGQTKSDSVTDSFGQVHGHPWLHVADASLFPQSSHVNPYLTVMALADRIAENIIRSIK